MNERSPFQSMAITQSTTNEMNINDNNNSNNIQKYKKSLTSISLNKNNIIKYPKLENYKRKLFRNNVLSSEKNYLLEDYMRKKELDLIKFRNKKTIYDARKTFFTEEKINNNRYSYMNREQLFDRKNKFTLMIKDIESNFILLKDKRNRKLLEYINREKLKTENNDFKDFNEKLGVKNVFIKPDKLFNKQKTFVKTNLDFIKYANNYFKAFNSNDNDNNIDKDNLSRKKRKFIIK
jgi:hypothetical protein